MAESSNANTTVSGLKASTKENSREDTQSSRRESSSGNSGKTTTQSQPDLPPSASKKRSAPEPAASPASHKAGQGGLRTKSRCIKRARKAPQTSSSNQEISNTDDTSSGEVEEVVMPSTTLDLATSKSVADKAATLAKPSAETQEPITSSSAAPMVLGEGYDLSSLLTFDPESIEPAASKASEESGPSATHGQLQHLKALLSSSIETLVEDTEEVKSILEDIQPHLPVTLQVKLWPVVTLSAYRSRVTLARSFLDATIAKSRQIENTETPNENAATPVNSPEFVEYSSDDLDEDYVELDDDFIEKCNATTDARKIKKLLAEHAVRYKLSPDPKFATSPINIRDKDYDFSLDLSHIAIVEKTPFCGTEKESDVEHMTELSTLSGLFSDDIKMRTYFVAKIFPFSLKDDAKTWYNNLSPGSIKSPKELLDVFFRKYFPASAQHAALQRIYNFDQEDGEKLPEAWARFCSLIRAQPDHDLEKHDLLDIFYSGLTIESRTYLDSCAGCVFRKRTPDDAEELLAKIGRNHDDWSTPEPTPTPIVKKRGMIKLNDEDMREAKKSLKEKGIKPEDVKNLPPIEDICETIPPSSMIEYMKDIVTNKRKIPNEEISTMLANYSFNGKIPKKLGDPDKLIPTDISLQMADKSTAIPVGLCENVPVQVTQHCLILTDFVVLEMPEDDNMSIILGRPFLNTAGAVIDCNKGMVTFNVDDKEHTVYFPKRIDKKGKMKKFKFGELFKKGTTSTGRPSRASTQIRRSYNEDVIAPSFAPEEDNGAPNASSFPCYDFLTNAGILDDFFTLVNRAGLATYVGDEREQYYRLTKIFVESFKFHNTQYEPTVAFKIYDIPVTMELEEFCRALDIAPVGTARRIDDNPRDLLELYRGITEDDCRTIQRGKIRNIQLPAIKYFAYYIATSILGRENTSNISSYHLAFLNAALTGETSYHLGSLIARRLSSRGPIFGGTIALRILTHLKIPLDSNDVPLTPRRLDIAAMKSHHFVTTDSTIDNMVYRMLFADGNEKEIPLPQPGLFNIDRQSWSLTKEEVEEHMKIQEFHQQHDSENAEPSYDCTVTYPDVSSSTYLEPGRSSSYYGDTTSWGPWE
ncbi:hypothetical protein QYE76_059428 [Lolium multiflorum]|uniref:Retrotransposon gag domain-containing protein n=1 Tax=Lolium multiflorum TaxID=4521 RepID=A0AAD8RYP6_LOLMU|nr:hypothetical protein QYE76_059428 [Lolium multiflorum]